MNALIVGFGVMGCRHAQSLLNAPGKIAVSVVEPSDENFSAGLNRINFKPSDVTRYLTLDEIKTSFDIAIVATSSAPRYDVVKALIAKGIKTLLLEKVVFQSLKQFDEIINLLQSNNAKAYCNFANRYFQNYIQLKNNIGSGKVNMNVTGGEFGLASNALHYLDLFEYLTDSKMKITNSSLHISDKENKRGIQYRELHGSLSGGNHKGDVFSITSDISNSKMPVIMISADDPVFVFDQNTQKEIRTVNGKTSETEFQIIPTSVLTYPIVTDILAGKTHLTTVQETRNVHQEIFKYFNPVFGLENKTDTLCPIT